MFFIGPSVNIFVYLLVSAFFVVCFYQKGEAKPPEILPGKEIHVYNFTTNEVVCYHETREEKTKSEVKKPFTGNNVSREQFYNPPAERKSPYLTLQTLRAPPTCQYMMKSTTFLI